MYIKRDLEEKLLTYLHTPEILGVFGPRQSGKSTLIGHLFADLPNSHQITFEDVEALDLFESDIKSFAKLHIEGHSFVFIDEVQYAPSFGQRMKYLFDTYKNQVKFFVSGSSTTDFYLKGLKYLVGRIFIFHLFPFSFKEFLRYKNENLLKVINSPSVQNEVNRWLEEFIIYGGYPRVVLANSFDEKKVILKNLYNILVQREITSLATLLEQQKVVRLIRLLAVQTGTMLNYTNLASDSVLSLHEVRRFLDLLQKTFIIQLVPPFFTNKKLEIVKNPKTYFIDTGFRNAVLDDFSNFRPDMGTLHESFVFEELIKQEFQPYYWRSKSKAEVDFVIRQNHTVIPLEVKTGTGKISRSFRSFINQYHPEMAFLINREVQEEQVLNNTRVKKIFFGQLTRFEDELMDSAE